jgi:hypothetical protein
MSRHRSEIPLSVAAHRLKWPWSRAFNAVLTGRLVAERRGSRWFVNAESLARLERVERERLDGRVA